MLNQSQFNLQSNLKNKPNAQGTLFSASPSQRTPESRQPRGYSPERMDAVRQKLPVMGKALYEIPGKPTRTSPSPPPRMISGREQLTQTVARSTVPLSDLKGLGYVSTPPRTEIGGVNSVPTGAAGVYNKESDDYPAHIGVVQNSTHTFVPIHEIGHHTDRDSPYHTPHEKGRAEGFADAYAVEHAKKPGYKSRPATVPQRNGVASFGVWTKGMSPGMAMAFEDKYKQQRPDPLQPAQFGHGTSDLPKEHIEGQIPLLDKVKSGWGTRETTNWDYPLGRTKPTGVRREPPQPDPAGYAVKFNKG